MEAGALILTVVLGILLGAAAIIVLLLVMPLRIELRVAKGDRWQVQTRLQPFSPMGPRIRIPLRAPGAKRAKAKPASRKSASSGRWRPSLSGAMRLLGDLVGCFRLERVEVDATVGFSDPAETGAVYGALAALTQSIASCPRTRIAIQPDFTQAILQGSIDLVASLRLIGLLGPLARFAWQSRKFAP
jgi:hypothetical protein